jgi:hypothetical protein
MTRETKLGLGVATSFLSLVVVVAYSAWTKSEDPQSAPEPTPPISTGVAQASPKTDAKPTAPAKPTDTKEGGSGPAFPEPQRLPDGQSSPNGPASPLSPALTKEPHLLERATSPGANDLQQSGLQVKGISGEVKLPGPPLGGEKSTQQDAVALPAAPKTKPIEMPPYNDDLQHFNGDQFVGSGPVRAGSQPTLRPEDLAGKGAAVPGGPSGVSELTSNVTPPMPAGPNPPVENQNSQQLNSNGPPATPTTPPAPLPTNPVVQPLNMDQLPANPTALGSGIGGTNLLDPKQASQGSFPTAPVNPAAQNSSASAIQNQDMSTPHSIAIPPGPVPSSPAAPPGVGTKPQVQQYDERKYVCQASDTDFTAVSKQVYNSDKYAQALMEYNRDHFLGKAAVQPTGRLQPGAVVYIPPVHVLEGQYPGAISVQATVADGSKVVPGGPAAPPKALVQVSPSSATGSPVPPPAPSMTAVSNPSPQPPQDPAPISQAIAPTPGPAPNPGPIKLYTVPQGGQQFYEIARDTLGNGLRWNEIYQLNQQYDPKFAVPAGTQLRIPPDAHLGQ